MPETTSDNTQRVDPAFGGISIGIDPTFGGIPIEGPEEAGFISNVQEDLKTREQEGLQSAADLLSGEIGPARATRQILGKYVAGSVFDILGEGLSSAGRGLSYIIPDSIEEPAKEAIMKGWDTLTETDIGKAAGEAMKGGLEQYMEFKEENPQAAKDIEASLNIAALFAPVKVKVNAKPSVLGDALDKSAKTMGKIAGKQISSQRTQSIGDLIRPRSTPKVMAEEVTRTKEVGKGPFKRSIVELSPRQKEITAEVKRIKGVSTKNTIQGNYNIIEKANRLINKQLERDVAKSRAVIPHVEAEQAMGKAITRLVNENPVIVGNAQATATKVANKAIQLISENDPTPLGMLKSRKQLDSWIRVQKGDKAFDPALENSLSISVRAIRREMNDIVDSKVVNTKVKAELKRQNLLFEAIENIGPKAADEANTAIGRTVQNIAKVLPFRSKFVQEAGTIVGLGIVGASTTFAPVFAGGLATSVATTSGARLLLGPGMKIKLGKLINGVDAAILSSKNPSMLKQLRADRALVLELIKNSEEEQE